MPTLPALAYSVLLLAAIPGCAAAQQGPAAVRATFAILDSSGGRIGQVTGTETRDAVQLQVLVSNLAPGRHGLHLHANPTCQPPAFTSAGGHLNPDRKQHGSRNPSGAHLGDLPNLVVDAEGVGRAQVVMPGVTLNTGPRSIGVPGTALVIHADPDDELTDPAGNAGSRIGCAVLAVAGS